MPKFEMKVTQRFRFERTAIVSVEADTLEDAIEAAEADESVRDHLSDWSEEFHLIDEVVTPA